MRIVIDRNLIVSHSSRYRNRRLGFIRRGLLHKRRADPQIFLATRKCEGIFKQRYTKRIFSFTKTVQAPFFERRSHWRVIVAKAISAPGVYLVIYIFLTAQACARPRRDRLKFHRCRK